MSDRYRILARITPLAHKVPRVHAFKQHVRLFKVDGDKSPARSNVAAHLAPNDTTHRTGRLPLLACPAVALGIQASRRVPGRRPAYDRAHAAAASRAEQTRRRTRTRSASRLLRKPRGSQSSLQRRERPISCDPCAICWSSLAPGMSDAAYHRSGAYATISGEFGVGGGSQPAFVATERTNALPTYPLTSSMPTASASTARLTIRQGRLASIGDVIPRSDEDVTVKELGHRVPLLACPAVPSHVRCAKCSRDGLRERPSHAPHPHRAILPSSFFARLCVSAPWRRPSHPPAQLPPIASASGAGHPRPPPIAPRPAARDFSGPKRFDTYRS